MLIWSYDFPQAQLPVCVWFGDEEGGQSGNSGPGETLQPRKHSLKNFIERLMMLSSFIKPISFSAKVIWETSFLHPLPLLISLPAEKFSFLQLFLSPSTGPCLHLVNKVGKGPGSSSWALSVPNALNGHDTARNFRFSAIAGKTSAG